MPATLLPASAHALFDAPLPDRAGALALSRLAGVGPRTWRTLLAEHAGDADQAASARRRHDVRAWAAARDDARALLDAAAGGPYSLLLPGDAAYPRRLLDLPDPPVTLWVAGGHAALAHAPRSSARARTPRSGSARPADWSPSSRSAARRW